MQLKHLFSMTPIVAAVLMSCGQDESPDVTELAAGRIDERPNIIVVFTDDQGYADLGANGVAGDIKTPHLDQLADDGVRMTAGYVTAPQCTPSRAALLTGKYQQRFGLDDNTHSPLSTDQQTIATRFQQAGYRTGMAGKWHLDINRSSEGFDFDSLSLEQRTPYFPDNKGFDDVYFGYLNTWWTNFTLQGRSVSAGYRNNRDYRLDVTTDAGLAFIEQNQDEPFFLYLAYFAPHVPLEATEDYLSRHESATEIRRQYGLAMMSAVDDGIGRLRDKLDTLALTDDTIIFFLSDNGAPLGLTMEDAPIDDNGAAWDGSLNTPWLGEKGMLSEGGIRVPYIVSWPGKLPSQTVFNDPVSSLDVAATGLALANADTSDLDGENLMPYLNGTSFGLNNRPLYWRFWNQAAIRQGPWKYLIAGDREYLFDLSNNHEHENLIDAQPTRAGALRQALSDWTDTLHTPGLPEAAPLFWLEEGWYDHHIPN
jgi:arylsulfatase A-like enzyme